MYVLGISFPFEKSIIGLLLWFDSILLHIFSVFYKSYLIIAQTKIFQEGAFNDLINNIYLIFGVIALFILAWILLKNLINPDGDKGTKQVKDVVVRFVLVGIITCLVPTIFNFLNDFQNSLLAYNVVPNVILGNSDSTLNLYDENGEYTESVDVSNIAASTVYLSSTVNKMAVSLIQGILYPIDSNGNQIDDLEIDVSEYWGNTTTKIWGGAIGCVGAGIIGAILVFTGVGAAPGVAGATAICAAGAGAGVAITNLMETIDAEHYTWQTALKTMQLTGSYDEITLFAGAIKDGNMHYTALLSTAVIIFLVYMIISFCIDLAVRACKLSFYEVMAPICLLISVIPQKKELMTNWFKIVLTTWAEIFIRIGCVCGVVLLVGKIDFSKLISISHPLISGFILVGLVLFAKQVPSLFSKLTGLDSNNMKLGIKDKLKEARIPIVSDALGTGAKKLAAGLDAKAHGRRFKEGANQVEGYVAKAKKKIGGYLPYSAKAWESKKAYKETQDTLDIARSNYANYGTADDFIEKKGDAEIRKALHDKKEAKKAWAKAQADLKALVASGTATSEQIQAAEKNLADATNRKDLTDKEFKDLLGTKARLNEVYKSLKYYEDSGRMSLDNSDNNIMVENLRKVFEEHKTYEPIIEALDNLNLGDKAKKTIQESILESLELNAKKNANGNLYTSQDEIVKNINNTLLNQLSGEMLAYQNNLTIEFRKQGITDDAEITRLVAEHMDSLKTQMEKTVETNVRDTVAPLKEFSEAKESNKKISKGYKAKKNEQI